MKLMIPLVIAAGLGLASLALADPSQTGLENGRRLGWDKQSNPHFTPDVLPPKDCRIHSVPDAGGTLGLLSLGIAGLAFWRLKSVA